jgi:type IV pilus assembly protein PilQ
MIPRPNMRFALWALFFALSLSLGAMPALGQSRAELKIQSKKKGQRTRITLDLMDADIRNVIRLFGEVGGINVVMGDAVSGKVTLKLKNVPWNQALEVVLQTKGLQSEFRGNILRVAPRSEFLAEARARAEAAKLRAESGPLVTRVIPVNNARAEDLLPLVEATLTPRGKASYDARTNVIIVTDVRR